jgi:hypothetical protein
MTQRGAEKCMGLFLKFEKAFFDLKFRCRAPEIVKRNKKSISLINSSERFYFIEINDGWNAFLFCPPHALMAAWISCDQMENFAQQTSSFQFSFAINRSSRFQRMVRSPVEASTMIVANWFVIRLDGH